MNEVDRGKNAERLLDDPVLKEAFDEIEKYQVSRWRSSGNDSHGWDVREEAHSILLGLDAFKDQLFSFITTGRMAETKTNRRKE